MKKIASSICLSLLFYTSFCQVKSAIDSAILKDNGKLVGAYTYRKLFQRSFATMTIGDNGFSKVGRYATLDINADESKFYFSPLVFERKQKDGDEELKSIHSIDISGSVNSSNIFDFKNKNTVTLGYSFTRVFNNYKYDEKDNDKALKSSIKNEVIAKETPAFGMAGENTLYRLDKEEAVSRPEKYQKKLVETIAAYEESWAADKWKKKKITWIKLNFNVLSFDNFFIIDNASTATYTSPASKSVFVPSINFSYNAIKTSVKTNNEFYYSGWLRGSIKHRLSEFSQTSEWIQYEKLSETSFLTMDKNDVYVINESDLKRKLSVDFGAQATYLFHITSGIKTGLDLSGSYKSIVADKNNANAVKCSIGLIFPFTDKKGATTINIEPFYSFTKFTNINIAHKNFWGIRFGLPFSKP